MLNISLAGGKGVLCGGRGGDKSAQHTHTHTPFTNGQNQYSAAANRKFRPNGRGKQPLLKTASLFLHKQASSGFQV